MADENKKKSRIAALILQMIISLLYGAMLVHTTVILMSGRRQGWFIALVSYLPQLVIIIASVVLQFILRIRHRSHTQEGSLLPLLFTFIALEATYILPLNSRNRLYLTLSLFASLFISLAAPVSTDSYGTTLFTSSYDAYLYTAIALIYAATAFTYIAAVVKDRATHTPGRAASYILLMIGNFISLGTGFISAGVSMVLYIIGVAMLSVSSRQTF